jgi:argininosuccinate lyase
LRARLLDAMEAVVELRTCLVQLAAEHRGTLMPAYTHNQPAQPTTLGHYLMAMVEILERDTERLRGAFIRVNRCPLGACAITTTGFPIRRDRTAELLGFDGVQVNSYGAIASVDYVAESCSALTVMMLSLGRFAQDLLLWSTAEFGYLRLSDGYVQISSIMPQKRNPVPLEHVRILASRAMSESQAVLSSLHNTPFADMNDSEDPLQPLVDLAFGDGVRALTLLAGILSETTFDTGKMETRAQGSFLTVTELADTIVRTTGLSFHEAHGIVSRAVKALAGNFDRKVMVELVSNELATLTGRVQDPVPLYSALEARNFVDVRRVIGGPAAEALDPQISRAETQVKADRETLEGLRRGISDAGQTLRAAVERLKLSAG